MLQASQSHTSSDQQHNAQQNRETCRRARRLAIAARMALAVMSTCFLFLRPVPDISSDRKQNRHDQTDANDFKRTFR